MPDSDYGDKVDLFLNDKPAVHLNGTAYGTHLFTAHAVQTIHDYAAVQPAVSEGLFLYIAWQNTHAPLQVPTSYCYNSTLSSNVQPGHTQSTPTAAAAAAAAAAESSVRLSEPVGQEQGRSVGREHHASLSPPLSVSSNCPSEGPDVKGHSWCYCYDNEGPESVGNYRHANSASPLLSPRLRVHGNRTAGGDNRDRHTFNAMARVMDEGVYNVTSALKQAGLWETTLLVFSADNGGAINIAQGAGNNFPLRGGKHTAFEGGVRSSAFVSGGWLPPQLRGTVNSGYIHVADWWATFCSLAGVCVETTACLIPFALF